MGKYDGIYDKKKDKTIDICLNCKKSKCEGQCLRVGSRRAKSVIKPAVSGGVEK